MVIIKEKLSLIYKIIIVIISGLGIYLNIKAFSFPTAFIYYTIQSNIFCFVFFFIIVLLTIFNKLKKNNLYYTLKGMCTMSITITMLIYQFVISKNYGVEIYATNELACVLAHLVIPILVIGDYIVFGEKGNLKKSYPFIWSLTLIFYVIFNIIYVLLGGKFIDGTNYPYYYMNIDKYGLLRVTVNCLLIYTFFIVYGVIVQFLDRKLSEYIKMHKKVLNERKYIIC